MGHNIAGKMGNKNLKPYRQQDIQTESSSRAKIIILRYTYLPGNTRYTENFTGLPGKEIFVRV